MSDAATTTVESDRWSRMSLGDKAKTKYTLVIGKFKRRPQKVGDVIRLGTVLVRGLFQSGDSGDCSGQ